MKEIIIFFVIMILALVILFATEGFELQGANILSALRFDFKTPSETTSENKETEDTASTKQYTVKSSAPKTSLPQSQPPSPEPIQSEPSGYTSSKKPEALSIYYQKIKISGVTKKSKSHPSVIKLSVSTKEEIDLTGFTIQTRHGEFKIPQGVEKYKAGRGEKDITIEEYIRIYVIGGPSPLKTDAFRVNACFGYLKHYNEFYPSISSRCPKPAIEDLYHLHPYCQDYISKLRSCEIPDYSNNLKIATNSYCTSYITENLNYSGCYRNLNKEDDFLKNYWHIYTRSDLVEPLHDIIYLYDKNDYLVDDYSY